MSRGYLLAATALAALVGCSVLATKSDYAAYRAVQLAEGPEARAIARADYLEAHPDGRWSSELRARHARLEPRIYEQNEASVEGLRFYLRAYPRGPHAAQARSRLEALGAVAASKRSEQEQEREAQQRQLERMAERRRTWATRAVTFWLRTLLGIDQWGAPIPEVAEANPDFDRAYGKNPRPHCSRAECIKFYRLDYSIPVPGSTRLQRTVELLLRLRVEEGRLQRAELLLPGKGFSRWYELANQTLVTDEDPTQRQEAIEWAVSQIEAVVDRALPDARDWGFVPEPVDPPTVRAPREPDEGASDLPGEPAAEEPQDGDGDGEPATEPGEPAEPTAPAPAPESLSLPIAIEGFRAGDLRVGVFAAADDDYDPAYDGVFMELAPPEERAAEGEPDAAADEGPAGAYGGPDDADEAPAEADGAPTESDGGPEDAADADEAPAETDGGPEEDE